jgi:hypothetical protein
MASLGSAALMAMMMFSDENMKTGRKPADGEGVLRKLRDMPIDDYQYKNGPQQQYGLPEQRTGPMAQDYQRAFGGEGSDGRMVDLGDAVGKILAAIKALDRRTISA